LGYNLCSVRNFVRPSIYRPKGHEIISKITSELVGRQVYLSGRTKRIKGQCPEAIAEAMPEAVVRNKPEYQVVGQPQI
jgi:hypothetical protein